MRTMEATKPHLEATEAELIQRACQGDKEAFCSLVRPCGRAVYTVAVSILNNPEDAEEVAQEAVLKALPHLAGFRGKAKFSTWLIRIAINEARLKLRRDRRHLYEPVDELRTSEDGEYFPKDYANCARFLPRHRGTSTEGAERNAETRYRCPRGSTHAPRRPTARNRRSSPDPWDHRRECKNPTLPGSPAVAGCASSRHRR